jgi:hypothetical protein
LEKKEKQNKDKEGCMLNIELIYHFFRLSLILMFDFELFFLNLMLVNILDVDW